MNIKFITSSKELNIIPESNDQILIDLLKSRGIPYNSVSIYLEKETGNHLYTGLYKTIKEISELASGLLIVANRNIDYVSILDRKVDLIEIDDATSEYSFDSLEESDLQNHIELNSKECIEFVVNRVKKFLVEESDYKNDQKIVIGVSGGGDSNALLEGILNSKLIDKKNIIPVMILGIPDWDKGLERAEDLCKSYDMNLIRLEGKIINQLLGKKNLDSNWARDFEKIYPDSDGEIIGTLAVRLGLSLIAKRNNTDTVVTGLNMEDIIAECLYATFRGESPLPFPVREIDKTKFWYPLYRCPKKIIDGCFPKQSLENYEDRYPSKLYWRAISYYTAQSVHTLVPGLEYAFLEGFKSISNKKKRKLFFNKKLGFSTTKPINDLAMKKWEQYKKM